jgi:N-acetylglutamate synthase-like GNAT family acetyltransferase
VRSIVVGAPHQGHGIGVALVNAVETLARRREYRTLFAVSNNDAFFRSRGYLPREIPELSRERSEVTRFKGVYAKDLG